MAKAASGVACETSALARLKLAAWPMCMAYQSAGWLSSAES